MRGTCAFATYEFPHDVGVVFFGTADRVVEGVEFEMEIVFCEETSYAVVEGGVHGPFVFGRRFFVWLPRHGDFASGEIR